MVKSYYRGHPIYFTQDTQEWLYLDDNTSADIERPCVICHKFATLEGYDPCLGHIESAKSACCGHGVHQGYVVYDDKIITLDDIGENS
jgi:hypothetical protein